MNTLVYVVGPASCQTWQHVYTAVTRGRNRVTLVTRQSDLVIAVSRQPQRRNTSLREKMGEQLKDLGVSSRGRKSSYWGGNLFTGRASFPAVERSLS